MCKGGGGVCKGGVGVECVRVGGWGVDIVRKGWGVDRVRVGGGWMNKGWAVGVDTVRFRERRGVDCVRAGGGGGYSKGWGVEGG